MAWFSGNADFFSLMQIGLDLCLMGVMLFLLRKRAQDQIQADKITAAIQKLFEDAQILAEGFDANLKERQDLMRGLLERLDEQLQTGERLRAQLERLQENLTQAGPPPTQADALGTRHSQQRLIHQLAQQGLPAKAIAERLQKPLGEVELVLNLRNLAKRG